MIVALPGLFSYFCYIVCFVNKHSVVNNALAAGTRTNFSRITANSAAASGLSNNDLYRRAY